MAQSKLFPMGRPQSCSEILCHQPLWALGSNVAVNGRTDCPFHDACHQSATGKMPKVENLAAFVGIQFVKGVGSIEKRSIGSNNELFLAGGFCNGDIPQVDVEYFR